MTLTFHWFSQTCQFWTISSHNVQALAPLMQEHYWQALVLEATRCFKTHVRLVVERK